MFDAFSTASQAPRIVLVPDSEVVAGHPGPLTVSVEIEGEKYEIELPVLQDFTQNEFDKKNCC